MVAITSIRNVKQPAQIWYASRLIELYEPLSPPIVFDPNSLLPQLTESLIGWKTLKNINPVYKQVLVHFVLITMKRAFITWKVSIGKDTSDLEVESSSRAKQIIPEDILFYRSFSLGELLNYAIRNFDLSIDPEMRNFLVSNEFKHLFENSKLNSDSTKLLITHRDLAQKVPFSKYNEEILPVYSWHSKRFALPEWINRLVRFAEGFGTVGGIPNIFIDIFESFSKKELKTKDKEKISEITPNLVDDIVKYTNEIENKAGDHLDIIDDSRGPINIQ